MAPPRLSHALVASHDLDCPDKGHPVHSETLRTMGADDERSSCWCLRVKKVGCCGSSLESRYFPHTILWDKWWLSYWYRLIQCIPGAPMGGSCPNPSTQSGASRVQPSSIWITTETCLESLVLWLGHGMHLSPAVASSGRLQALWLSVVLTTQIGSSLLQPRSGCPGWSVLARQGTHLSPSSPVRGSWPSRPIQKGRSEEHPVSFSLPDWSWIQ